VTSLDGSRRRARARRSRRDAVLRSGLVVVVLVLTFLLGIAFARTLDERPETGGTETIVRTLTPLPQEPPACTVTVTVTATGP
jgi:hypothetical protein